MTRIVQIDEVQGIGAEVLCEYHRLSRLPSTGSEEEDFLRITRLIGIAVLKHLPEPSEHHRALLRRALGDA